MEGAGVEWAVGGQGALAEDSLTRSEEESACYMTRGQRHLHWPVAVDSSGDPS